MERHPNEFTRRIISRYFEARSIDVSINSIPNGYVIFLNYFSAMEGKIVDEPSGRLIFDDAFDEWKLYWISGNFLWHFYGRYHSLHEALNVVISDEAANLFHKVL